MYPCRCQGANVCYTCYHSTRPSGSGSGSLASALLGMRTINTRSDLAPPRDMCCSQYIQPVAVTVGGNSTDVGVVGKKLP